jgi:F-type H+-transporting ATPase subunit epsilon
MSNNKIHLKITTPVGIFFEDDISELIAPGIEGYFGVQYGHTPFLTSIRPGVLTVYINKTLQKYAIHDGFVVVDPSKVHILTETIEKPEDIDRQRAEKEKQRAETLLKERKEGIDFREVGRSLYKAIARLEVVENNPE